MHLPLSLQLDRIVQGALEEDLGSGDVGSSLLFAEDVRSRAVIQAKDAGIVAGLPLAQATFQKLASDLIWNLRRRDGERVSPGEIVADIDGPLRAILAGERVALNFLQRLSGIATLTGRFVDAVQDFAVKILDTRKTAPGLRILDKYAVQAGGGFNHRFGLYDGILIKDNHVRAAGGVREALRLIRCNARPMLKIEVEVTSVEEAQEAAEGGADIIMLDNMTPPDIAEAVRVVGGRARTEASGRITLEAIREIAAAGVDYISVGVLTHSAPALDLSLEVV